jgi:hypothetical protein
MLPQWQDSQSGAAFAMSGGMKSHKTRVAADERRSWRVSVLRDRAQYLGIIEAPTERAAQAVAVAQFSLTEEHRRRLVLEERD